MKEIFLLATVALLLLVGLAIALGSGEGAEIRTSRSRVFLGNVWLLMLRLVGYGAGLVVVHRAIGSPSLPIW